MHPRFQLTPLALVLAVSFSPLAATTAFAVDLNGTTQTGNLTNAVTDVSINITNGATLRGNIINNGTVWNSATGGSGIKVDASTVDGSIRNEASRQVVGDSAISIRNASSITGDIVNVGLISGNSATGVGLEVTGGSTITGRISNSGNIEAGVVVSGATVRRGISNTGTITSKSDGVAIDVSGAATPVSIANTGTIDGSVRLGSGTLDINGGSITGVIDGSAGTVNINIDYTPLAVIRGRDVNVARTATLTMGTSEVKGLLSVAGTLAGSGEVGPTTLLAGATLSPGTTAMPVGILQVNGDLTFDATSTYRVDATADGRSDKVHALGVANLAGSVLHVGSGGTYAAATAYTILTADGGLNGSKFTGVSSNLAFLDPKLAYNGNDVVLKVELKTVPVDPGTPVEPGTPPVDPATPPVDTGTPPATPGGSSGATRPIEFADLAVTGNQRSTARALQSLPTTNTLYSRVLNLPEGAPAGVFADLAGESHVSTVSAMQNVTNNVVNLPLAHLHANMNAGWVPGPATAQVGRGDASALPRSAAQPMWAQVFGNWRTMDGNGNAAKARETDAGLFVGGDHGIGNGWRLGGALGYTSSRITVNDRSAKTDVDSYSAIIYGGKAFEAGAGKLNVSGGVAYTWHDVSSKRNINAAGQLQALKSDYSASTGQVFTEVGYAIPLNDRVTLEPFVGADFSDLRTRGFSESGGDAALSGRGNSNKVATTTLGLHAQTTFDMGQNAARLRGTLGWRHAYGDVNPETTMSFDGSQPFTVAGTPLSRDAAVVALGVDMAMSKNATLGLAYSGQFGNGNQQNTGTVNVSWRF